MTPQPVARANLFDLFLCVLRLVAALFTTTWGHVVLAGLAALAGGGYLFHRRSVAAEERGRDG